MAYYIVAAGPNLYSMSVNGVATPLTLPAGITIDQTRRPRMAILGRNVIVVNGVTRSVLVRPDNTCYPLMLAAPSGAPVLAPGAAGGYSGNVQGKYTFIVVDKDTGALILESDFSPASAASGPMTSKLISGSGINWSSDSIVTARRMYRTTTGPGSTYFKWIDVEGNTTAGTLVNDDMPDSALGLVAAPTDLGMGPGGTPGSFMTIVCQWKNRLWGVGDTDIDTLRFTADSKAYAWPETYGFSIAPAGGDQYGVTGLAPRRDELGVGKRNYLYKIIGAGSGSAPLFDFQVIKVKEGAGAGIWAPDSVVIINDMAYYLGEFGVNRWGPNGVDSMVDGKVRKWFTTDNYFNRSEFPNAFGKYNARYHTYELHLASAGQTQIDRWVSLDITTGGWYGPHKTDKMVPTIGKSYINAGGLEFPIIGAADGYIYVQNQPGYYFDDDTPIAIDWESKYHDGRTPMVEKLFRELSVASKGWGTFGNIVARARAGTLQADGRFTIQRENVMPIDGRNDKQTLDGVGQGRYAQIAFIGTSQVDQGCEIYGYEVPFFEIGVRQ